MKPSLLELLECPDCRGALSLTAGETDNDEVLEGTLACACRAYPIVRGVPRLIPTSVDPRNWETAFRFGEEWNQFSMMTDEYEKQFLSWIEPVQPGHFQDKVVLDVGCGKGRHVFQAQKFGAKTVVGIDLSHAVDAAFRNVGRLPGVHIIQADIYHLPLKPAFDCAYSIGVLHHTPEPARSFQCMVDKIKTGGSVSAWVYGREGNWWIIYLLNPIRRITSFLPVPVTKAIAFVLTVVLYAALLIVYRPFASSRFKKWLPYGEYLCSISRYSFREIFCIVLDHLIPEIAFYIREGEFRKWFADAHLRDAVITRRYNNSWRGFAWK